MDVRAGAMDAYNARIRRALAKTAWAATGKSWYKTADGTITNNWPATTIRYWWQTRHARLADYHLEPQAVATPAESPAAAA